MSADGPRSGRHQLITGRLRDLLLGATAPSHIALESLPWEAHDGGPPLLPDVAVVTVVDVDLGPLRRPPAPLVEVLDPTENPVDLLERCALAGLQHLWTVDAATGDLTVYERAGPGRVVCAVAQPGTSLRIREPFPLAVDPVLLTEPG
ncbi:MAG: Uma2 family endonuclease [Acidimicrobiales bacterium]